MRFQRVLLVVFCSYFSRFEGKCLKDELCVGMRRGNQYDFDLPDAVAVNVQDNRCDAEWTVDNEHTAILDGKSINFTLPFKNVTTFGIGVNYCPDSVKYHVSCHAYTKDLTCCCTKKSTVSSTPLPSADEPGYPGFISTDLKRNHYAAYGVTVLFCCICLILTFIILRKKRDSAAEQNQPDSSV
ncbi:uncharacterized protein [Misgurnus anguillicaudatus]|uniref:uncharacterized protein isoform X2 n=1 Tax=Misgurnus anguillicaudatus TaxID=75329 RepID=UPI003CCF1A8E